MTFLTNTVAPFSQETRRKIERPTQNISFSVLDWFINVDQLFNCYPNYCIVLIRLIKLLNLKRRIKEG